MMQCSTLSCKHSGYTSSNKPTHTHTNILLHKLLQAFGPHDETHTDLKEACHIGDDVSEDVVIFLTVEPAQLGDPGVQLDQSLGHKGC